MNESILSHLSDGNGNNTQTAVPSREAPVVPENNSGYYIAGLLTMTIILLAAIALVIRSRRLLGHNPLDCPAFDTEGLLVCPQCRRPSQAGFNFCEACGCKLDTTRHDEWPADNPLGRSARL